MKHATCWILLYKQSRLRFSSKKRKRKGGFDKWTSLLWTSLPSSRDRTGLPGSAGSLLWTRARGLEGQIVTQGTLDGQKCCYLTKRNSCVDAYDVLSDKRRDSFWPPCFILTRPQGCNTCFKSNANITALLNWWQHGKLLIEANDIVVERLNVNSFAIHFGWRRHSYLGYLIAEGLIHAKGSYNNTRFFICKVCLDSQ